jgi:hypothetical protein
MRTIRAKATIKGVETEMLFTPRLFEFKTASMDFSDTGTESKVSGMYADLMYCAALNLWTLNEKEKEDFHLTRADFHEWAVLEPKEFGKTMRTALEALTNKSLEELIQSKAEQKPAENEKKVKKKSSLSIIRKLRRSW